jgi:hypothetical protein
MSTELDELRVFIDEYKPSLGKFECEPAYVEYFWKKCLEGEFDDEIIFPDDTAAYYVNLSKEECEICEIDPNEHNLIIFECSQGFVYCDTYTDKDYEEFLEGIEEEIENQEDSDDLESEG